MEHHAFRHAAQELHQHYTEQRESQRRILKEQLRALRSAQATIEKLEARLIETEAALAAEVERSKNIKDAYDRLAKRKAPKMPRKSVSQELLRLDDPGTLTAGMVTRPLASITPF